MWTHKGYDIKINNNGVFRATVGDLEVMETSLEGVKAQIDKVIKSAPARVLDLEVVGILEEDRTHPMQVCHAALIGINRSSRKLRFAGLPKDRDFTAFIMPDTPENTALIERLLLIPA